MGQGSSYTLHTILLPYEVYVVFTDEKIEAQIN